MWRKLSVAGSILAGLVLGLSACGSASPTSTPAPRSTSTTTATTTTTTTTAPSSTTTTTTTAPSSPSTSAAGPAKCTTGVLSVTLTNTQGAAGSTISDLVFTNRGSSPCTMTGYPGVSLVTGSSGTQVGEAATRSTAPVRTLTLQPGQQAVATLRQAVAGNFPASTCDPTPTRGFRVYPPNNTAAAFVAHPGQGCANKSLGQPQLFVKPVTTSTGSA